MLAQPRVKEKVIAIVSMRQSTNGVEQWIRQRSMPSCTRCCAFKAIRNITSGTTIMAVVEFLSQPPDLLLCPHHKTQYATGPFRSSL
jgi:hypothetical protein